MMVMHTHPFLKACFILYALVMLAGCSHSSSSDYTYSATIAEGRAAVQDVMAETGATSVSVALVDGDRVIWSEAFGKADREAGRSATTEYALWHLLGQQDAGHGRGHDSGGSGESIAG